MSLSAIAQTRFGEIRRKRGDGKAPKHDAAAGGSSRRRRSATRWSSVLMASPRHRTPSAAAAAAGGGRRRFLDAEACRIRTLQSAISALPPLQDCARSANTYTVWSSVGVPSSKFKHPLQIRYHWDNSSSAVVRPAPFLPAWSAATFQLLVRHDWLIRA